MFHHLASHGCHRHHHSYIYPDASYEFYGRTGFDGDGNLIPGYGYGDGNLISEYGYEGAYDSYDGMDRANGETYIEDKNGVGSDGEILFPPGHPAHPASKRFPSWHGTGRKGKGNNKSKKKGDAKIKQVKKAKKAKVDKLDQPCPVPGCKKKLMTWMG